MAAGVFHRKSSSGAIDECEESRGRHCSHVTRPDSQKNDSQVDRVTVDNACKCRDRQKDGGDAAVGHAKRLKAIRHQSPVSFCCVNTGTHDDHDEEDRETHH